jgi:hypothetical protein
VKLSPNTLAQVSLTQALIQQKETEMAALKNHTAFLIREDTGVDISKGLWGLDLQSGELTQPQDPTTEVVEGEVADA